MPHWHQAQPPGHRLPAFYERFSSQRHFSFFLFMRFGVEVFRGFEQASPAAVATVKRCIGDA